MKQLGNDRLLDYTVYGQYFHDLDRLGSSYVPKTFSRYIVIDIQNYK